MSLTGNLYADLSVYYDQFCADVDYIQQCDFARRAFGLFAASGGNDYFDLACGTGAHLEHMQAKGFNSSGLDNSQPMLDLAALRCPAAGLQLCDLAAFEQVEAFDLITCFLYSLHYSHPVSALQETLRRSWQALKPGGVFIFNAVDKLGIRNNEGITTRIADGEAQLSFQSGWHYRGEGEVLDLNLCITRQSAEGVQQWRDHHTMTALTLPEIHRLLAGIGFQVTVLEHDYGVMQPWNGDSFNAIFIACKPVGA